MREDCRHFASRTYDDGEAARFCVLDLAPEAPWRCPADCPSYERSVIDSTFVQGSLASTRVEDEPDESPDAIGDLLDDAEEVVEDAEANVLRELAQEQPQKRSWWSRRRRGSGDDGSDWRLSQR
jgi:hypothetical protein